MEREKERERALEERKQKKEEKKRAAAERRRAKRSGVSANSLDTNAATAADGSDAHGAADATDLDPLSTALLIPDPDQRRDALVLELAAGCQSVTSDPEGSVSELRALVALSTDPDRRVRRASYESLSRLFADLAPGYRVRPLGRTEAATLVSKEQRRLRNFEVRVEGGGLPVSASVSRCVSVGADVSICLVSLYVSIMMS